MNPFEFNLQSLRKRYPDLAAQMEHLKDDGSVRIAATRQANAPTAYKKVDTTEWLLHSKENPRDEAQFFSRVILRNSIKSANTIVLYGLGMGYYLEQIVAAYGHMNPLLMVVENDLQVFKKFLETQRPMVMFEGKQTQIFEFPMVHFIVGVPQDQIYFRLYDIIHNNNRTSFSTFHVVEHPVIVRYSKAYYRSITSEISRICYDIRSSYGNDPEDSWIGIDHMLQNLDIIANNPGAERTLGKFAGKPAIIVATGPSLNKNIHLLPQLKNKCIFFAADASLNTFLRYSPTIIPDIVCCLERNLSTKNHFEQIPDDKKHHMEDMYLAACPVVMPVVYRAWQGNKHMVVFRDFAHFKWLGLKTLVLNTGKSVTNMAFMLAQSMGCNPIILVGQDLAFAPDGTTHASGADHARDGLKASPLLRQRTKVMGNNGQMIESLDTWVGMLRRFEFDIDRLQGSVKVINATEGGAFIKGTEIMPLQEAIDKYMTADINTARELNNLMLPLTSHEVENNMNAINYNVSRGITWIEESTMKIDSVLQAMEKTFPAMLSGDIMAMMDVMKFADKVKEEVLSSEMCYLTIMHVLQSWCMGRDTLLRGIENYVPSANKDEQTIMKCILVFEFFYGLKLLFEYVHKGMVRDYYGEKS